jgi:hypothetical protein
VGDPRTIGEIIRSLRENIERSEKAIQDIRRVTEEMEREDASRDHGEDERRSSQGN